MKKALSVALSIITAVCVMQTSAVQGLFKNTVSTVQASQEQPQNPVRYEEMGITTYDYVNFGSYPQSEVTGEELTDAIKNAEYNADEEAVVDGVKYRRMKKANASYAANASYLYPEEFYYWKNSTSYHYFKYEPLKWKVLQNEGDSLLLLADQAIDSRLYSTKDERLTWDISPMRSWLNTYDGTHNVIHSDFTDLGGFSMFAFSDEEQSAMKVSHITTEDNHIYNVDGGDPADDKLFLLSIEDVTNPAYGFSSNYASADAARLVQPSEYAFAMGAWLGTYNSVNYGNCFWMLRSPGSYTTAIALVYKDGTVYPEGQYANVKNGYYGVCPAVRVDINSDLWTMANEVEPTAAPTDAPTLEPTVEPTQLPQIIYGDVDDSGSVELADANKVLKMALNIETDEAHKANADVDNSGAVDLADANLILKRALNIIDKFPVETSTATPAPTATPVVEQTATPAPTEEPTATPEPLVQTSYEPSGRIWIAADSIAAKHDNNNTLRDTIGWGVIMNQYLSSEALVYDTALSSRSAKSFSLEPEYKYFANGTTESDTIIINGEAQNTNVEKMGQGDYLLISFGHNDEFPNYKTNTDPYGSSSDVGSYKWYLKTYYIDPAIRAGATPVLISSVVKRNFVNGELAPQFHELYATAMQELAEEYAAQGITVPYIDLHHKMQALYQQLGEQQTVMLHGASASYLDNVHFSYAGAKYATKYILEGMKELNLDICKFRNEEAIQTLDSIELLEESHGYTMQQ